MLQPEFWPFSEGISLVNIKEYNYQLTEICYSLKQK
jgi:hypothetical protein